MSEIEVPGSDPVERHRDDLDDFLDEELSDPQFRGAYEDAMARSALLRALVSRRGERQLSQADVAALMGTTQSAVSDLERGATDPRLSTLQRFARAVRCQLRLHLHVDQPPARSWPVQQCSQVGWAAVTSSGYWTPLLEQLAGTGRARTTVLSAPADTTVAPVELRAEPDEFVQAVSK
jgi:transcriptional regulator with XRE-family HTH domain